MNRSILPVTPEPVTQKTLAGFASASIKHGISLQRLHKTPEEYACVLRTALFWVTQGDRCESLTHEESDAALKAFLQDIAPWLKSTPEELGAALEREGILVKDKSGVSFALCPSSEWTLSEAFAFVKSFQENRERQSEQIRMALQEKNRRINSKRSTFEDAAFDEAMMKEALREAQAAFEEGEVPVGAVLLKGKSILARDHNRVSALCDATEHAEMRVLKESLKALGVERFPPDTTLYVTLEPCPMCAGALTLSRIGRVVWGASDRQAGAMGSALMLQDVAAMNWKVRTSGGVLKGQAQALLAKFFDRCREKKDKAL